MLTQDFKIADSWYVPQEQFTEKQLMYVKLITETFNMANQLKQPVNFTPTMYQMEFHANSLNILLEEAKNILWLKARGISFSYNTIAELIMSGVTFDDQIFPVIAQRETNSKDINKVGWWMIQNSNNPMLKKQWSMKGDGQELVNTVTGSVIRAYPSNAASEAIRQVRLIRSMIDEFAFQTRDKELFTAVMHCTQGDIGQAIVGSTPKGRRNYFFELCNNHVGYKMFRLPVFDPVRFDPTRRPSLQAIKPIAPWISMKILDEDWERDRTAFMQENMNDFLDDSEALITYATIQRRISKTLVNLADQMDADPDAVYETNNPIIIGDDVAETSDYSAITAFEMVPIGNKILLVQRFLKTIRGISLPKQTEMRRRIIEFFPSLVKYRIDMTGIGQHMFEELRRDYGAVIMGVDFRKRIKSGQKGVTTKIREYMFTNLKNTMESEPQSIAIFDNALQTRHLGAINRAFEIEKDPKEGHGDILVSISLAAMPLEFKKRNASKMYSAGASSFPKEYDITRDGTEKLKSDVTPEEIQGHYDSVTWDDHIEELRKGGKRARRAFR